LFTKNQCKQQVTGPVEVLVKNTEWVDLNNSNHEGLSKEGCVVDVAEIAATQKSGNSSTPPLHNSFDLLLEDGELPSGEVRLADKDPNHISNVTLLESAEIVDKVSKEIVSLEQVAHSKVSVNVENDSYEPAAVLTENVNYGTPIIMLVTTYDEVLGPDKGKTSKPVNNTNNSKACRKSENFLSKFWADDFDTDQASNSTLEPDINAEIEGDIEDGSLFTPFMSKRQKKSNKKKHANKLNDTTVQSTSSEHIQTRSKKGVIKSNPKYL